MYNKAVDMWSLGVVFAELLTGKPLFLASSRKSMAFCFRKFNGNPHQFLKDKGLEPLSANEEDLLAQLLISDTKRRFTANEALKHEYFL